MAHCRDGGYFVNRAHELAAEQRLMVIDIIREYTACFEHAGFPAVFEVRCLGLVLIIHDTVLPFLQYVIIHDNRKLITVQ
ncbi:hypothetical protein D3C74_441080 [compost metagenome]